MLGQREDRAWGTPALLVAWSLLAAGISLRDGTYSPLALLAVTSGYAVLLATVVTGTPVRPLADPRAARRHLALPAALVAVGSVVWARAWYGHGPWLSVSHWATGAAVAAAITTLWPRWGRRREAWLVPAGLAAVAGVAMIVAAPHPHIDVWFLLQDSTRGLADGKNLYHQAWPESTGLYAVYPYLPITTVLLAPFRLLLSDVRYGLLLAGLLASFWCRRLAGPGAPALLALLVLVAPKATFALQQSWTEPLLLAALAGTVLAVRAGRPGWAVVAFAIALATKQHMVLLVPLAMWWPALGPRRTALAALLAGALVLPWVVADPVAFYHDAVSANLALGVQTRSLGLPSLLVRHGVTTSFLFTLAALAVAYAVVYRRRLVRDQSGFALAAALVLWTLNLTNKQAFFNHYTLPLGLIVLAVAAAAPASPPVSRAPEEPVSLGVA